MGEQTTLTYLCLNPIEPIEPIESMLIIASHITNLTDARYFAAKEVDFLGFNLEEGTEGYLDPMYMKAIREWVEGPRIVGEFFRSPAAVIREAAAFFGLDAVQVTAEYEMYLSELQGLTIILEVNGDSGPVGIERLFREAAPQVAYFLATFDTEASLLPQIDFWKNICAEYPVLLRADVSIDRLPEILKSLQPAGLSIAGGEEEQVGVKSFDEIEVIFEVIGR